MDKLMNLFPALCGRKLLVEDMDFEVSVRNALKWRGIHTVDQLLQLRHSELVQIFPNRNLRSYEDVIYRLVRLSEKQEGTGTAAPGFVSVSDISDALGGIEMSDWKAVSKASSKEVAEGRILRKKRFNQAQNFSMGLSSGE